MDDDQEKTFIGHVDQMVKIDDVRTGDCGIDDGYVHHPDTERRLGSNDTMIGLVDANKMADRCVIAVEEWVIGDYMMGRWSSDMTILNKM